LYSFLHSLTLYKLNNVYFGNTLTNIHARLYVQASTAATAPASLDSDEWHWRDVVCVDLAAPAARSKHVVVSKKGKFISHNLALAKAPDMHGAESTTTRFVRVLIKKNGTRWGSSLWTVAVHGTDA
jgi:hypothetical protein